ncbi:GNAT family N-acetyltransferase [Streptomyces zaomyceticus]|uniref:GNAT family N-acetyltransferase n=1 Tax=Streptomyces zaomyceticus TaxID=68286 RepID=UPI00371E04EA
MSENPFPVTTTAVRLPRYGKAEQDELLGDSDDPFGVTETGLTWLPKDEHFGIRDGERLVAHAGLVRIPVAIGDAETEMVGLGGVAVAPDMQGRGLARVVVAAALDHARTLGPDHAILFCRPPLVALYQRLGWHPVGQDVRVAQPGARVVVMPLRTMVTPLRDDARWTPEPLRLLSLPM